MGGCGDAAVFAFAAAEDSGAAMSSRDRPSALTARNAATRPAAHIRPAPIWKARTVSPTCPLSVRSAKISGPLMPPAAVPMA